MAFLRDINCNARIETLDMMVGMIKDGLLLKEDVIVSTDTLPQELKDQFEVIELDSKKQEISSVQSVGWSVSDDKQEVCLNGKTVTKLPGIPYKLFRCLLRKRGKFVNTETLEKCWDKKPNYDKFLVDKMNELKATLKNELTKKGINIQGEIIESQKNDKRKIIAYKLPG